MRYLSVILTICVFFAVSNAAPIQVYFNDPATKDYLYLESDLLKITIAKRGGKIIGWYLKRLDKDIALADAHGYAVLAQRLAIFDADNIWPEGWPTVIGTDDFETEIISINSNRARVKQTLTVPGRSIFSGLRVEKYYTFWGHKYHLNIEYVITNTSDETKSFWENGQQFGISLTVESTTPVGENGVIAFKSKGQVYYSPFVGWDFLQPMQTQWCAVSDHGGNYVMGSVYPSGLTHGLWPGEQRSGGFDYEIIFRSVVYHPGDNEHYHFTIYGGPGSIEDFQRVALGKESVFTEKNGVTVRFQLEQNYPNPFNPETEIRFQLPEAAHVVVKIFDTLGEEIRALVDAPYQAGYHSVRWDGKNKNGKSVSSGLYFYQLQADGFSQVKKMNLLR